MQQPCSDVEHGRQLLLFPANAKIIKPAGEKPHEFESSIPQAQLELEMNSDMKQQLREPATSHWQL